MIDPNNNASPGATGLALTDNKAFSEPQSGINNTTIQTFTQQCPPTTRPTPLDVWPDDIPDELTSISQWVCWKYVLRDKKWTKPPFQPNSVNASVTNPQHYSAFSEVVTAYEAGGFDGIGFVLTPNDPFVAIDLDHCLLEDNIITDEARSIIEQFDGYTEISPSGEGIRIFVKGSIPRAIKKPQIEMYDRGRYVTVTGHGWRP